ncbi:hypothetical protein P8452_35018 [Trifolium repens]|nr:hypothetical protein P8452_35018 [Trifolium repens]
MVPNIPQTNTIGRVNVGQPSKITHSYGNITWILQALTVGSLMPTPSLLRSANMMIFHILNQNREGAKLHNNQVLFGNKQDVWLQIGHQTLIMASNRFLYNEISSYGEIRHFKFI